ncbi:MAG: hypothetical protein K2L78_02685, partial [Muribaculaceae bacterium]|nr:hypothetical protein [Muribaculaceae bacterium]
EPTTFKFNPETTESTFEFSGNLVPLCEVKVNGVSIPSDAFDSTIHTIQVKDGDAIELTGGYPDIEVPLTVNVPADAAGVVSLKRELEGYYNYEDIEFTANEPVMVPAGSCILVTFDSSYNLKSAMVGENQIARYNGKFFVLNEAVDLDIDAAPWRTLSFTLNADDPTKFKVYPGSSTYGAEPYELVAGANNLTIEERQGCFLIKPESGFQVNSVTDADGNPYTPSQSSSNVYDVTEDGMVFNIVSGEMTYDNTWVLWIDSADNISTQDTDPYWTSSEFRGEYNYISDIGYSVQHNYAKALDEQFSFFIPTIKGFYLYLNGEFSRMHSEYSANCYHFFTPLNKVDVFRLYTTGEPAEKYALTFVTSGNKAADAQVVTDL